MTRHSTGETGRETEKDRKHDSISSSVGTIRRSAKPCPPSPKTATRAQQQQQQQYSLSDLNSCETQQPTQESAAAAPTVDTAVAVSQNPACPQTEGEAGDTGGSMGGRYHERDNGNSQHHQQAQGPLQGTIMLDDRCSSATGVQEPGHVSAVPAITSSTSSTSSVHPAVAAAAAEAAAAAVAAGISRTPVRAATPAAPSTNTRQSDSRNFSPAHTRTRSHSAGPGGRSPPHARPLSAPAAPPPPESTAVGNPDSIAGEVAAAGINDTRLPLRANLHPALQDAGADAGAQLEAAAAALQQAALPSPTLDADNAAPATADPATLDACDPHHSSTNG
ncbi:unnamed protein product, partial [Sphacelaria rigidula]